MAEPEGNASCSNCGSEWWAPVANVQDDYQVVGPAFVLTHAGEVAGYASAFLCTECETPWPGPYEGLRVVQ